MKIVELIICGIDKRFIVRIPGNASVADFAKIIRLQFVPSDAGRILLYHLESGRFLFENNTLLENGVESGDVLLAFF